MTAATAEPPTGGRRFALPSAYTILFILIVAVAILTWIIPSGAYDLDPDGEPIPGTYHQVDPNPQRIITDSLMAPINGLYGIEAEDGSVSVWNSGELFGAIDVALFILVIGGFLGVTMATGSIQGGISRIVGRLRGRESWMIPILMVVFALGGTTYGMAEESLAFYALIITVMIAAGYDSLVAASVLLLGCGIGVLGSTINPVRHGDRLGVRRRLDRGGHRRPADHPRRRDGHRHRLRHALCRARQGRSESLARLRAEGGQRGRSSRARRARPSPRP